MILNHLEMIFEIGVSTNKLNSLKKLKRFVKLLQDRTFYNIIYKIVDIMEGFDEPNKENISEKVIGPISALAELLYEKSDSIEQFYRLFFPMNIDDRLGSLKYFEHNGSRKFKGQDTSGLKSLHMHSLYIKNQISYMKNQQEYLDNLAQILLDKDLTMCSIV
jgi:hypothetical protein